MLDILLLNGFQYYFLSAQATETVRKVTDELAKFSLSCETARLITCWKICRNRIRDLSSIRNGWEVLPLICGRTNGQLFAALYSIKNKTIKKKVNFRLINAFCS